MASNMQRDIKHLISLWTLKLEIMKQNFILLKKHKISFICLAGFMKIIPKKLISYYRNKIINIHPSLLPKFKGLNTFSRMLKEKKKRQDARFIM